MVIDTDTIISVVRQVAGDEQIQLTVGNALKGAAISGAGSFVGALVAGPPGIAIGATIGGLFAYSQQRNQFVSVREALDQMDFEKKQRIADEVNKIITRLDITDLQEIVRVVAVAGAIANGVEAGNLAIAQRFIQESVQVIQRQLT